DGIADAGGAIRVDNVDHNVADKMPADHGGIADFESLPNPDLAGPDAAQHVPDSVVCPQLHKAVVVISVDAIGVGVHQPFAGPLACHALKDVHILDPLVA